MSKKITSTNVSSFKKISVKEGSHAYAELRKIVTKEGILDRDYLYYFFLTLFDFAGFFVSGYFLLTLSSTPLLIVNSIVFAFFSVQLAGLMHDAGHRGVFKSVWANDLFGHLSTGLIAMGFSAWKTKHNMHHAHTNQEDHDPDVDLPFLSFTKERYNSRKGISNLFKKYQAFLFYPLGSLLFISVRVTSIKYLLKGFTIKRLPEMVVLLAGIFVYFVLPFMIFPLSKALTVFFVTNFAVGFYLLNVFAPNHKGMPEVGNDVKFSFLEHQIMTSRNVLPGIITDFVYMGLNYQIEHHLFPACPRNKLKYIRPHVIKMAKRLGIEYTEVGIIETNKIIIGELHQIAASN